MTTGLFPDQLRTYVDGLVPPRPPELVRMEAHALEHAFPIIGPASGHCCYLLTRLVGARRVFELGSGYGYSTSWFARGVRDNGGGEVHHVVWDADLSARARTHLAALGYDDIVSYHVGEAVEILRGTKGPFDLIFLDIDKAGYPAAIPVIADRLRTGGILIADNMLWSGRVFDPSDRSPETLAIREATRLLTTSVEWLSTIVPIRDGLMVAMRV
ncbi:MAG TPA: O-methyltransferase [Vicinamibacterales bacterium]|nr:O-methyltransferase [Vicinamibacterales bacterium]